MWRGRRRDADLARPASATRCITRCVDRQPRLRRVARRRPHRARRRRSDQAEAAVPSQHRSAVRRRHALAAAAAGPQPADPRRRADVRQLQRRAALHLDVRHPRAEQPGEHRDLPAARRGRLLREGRQLRAAQPAREPARRVPELEAHLRHLLQRRRARVRHRGRVPAERDRLLRAAESREDDGPASQPAAGDPVVRLLRRSRTGVMYLTDPNAGLNILQFEGL